MTDTKYKESLQTSLESAITIAIQRGLQRDEAIDLLEGKQPKKGEEPSNYLTRLLKYVANYIEERENPEPVRAPTKDINMKQPTLKFIPLKMRADETNQKRLDKKLIFNIDGDTLEDKDLGEKELLMTSIGSALNSLLIGKNMGYLNKSALWTLTFSLIKVIPICSSMVDVTYDGNVHEVSNEKEITERFYEYNYPFDKKIVDYNYIKLAFYGIVSACKQITNDNKSALNNRFDKWCIANGIMHTNDPSPFSDVDSLLPTYYSMYNSTNWGLIIRNHIYSNSSNIPPKYPVLKSVYDAGMMIMKDYKQKHLTMFDKLLRNPTEVLILPSIIKELKHWRINKETTTEQHSEEKYPYLASLGILPKNLEQSNFPTLINAYLAMNPITNYKNSRKCDIPQKIIADLVSKPLITIQTLTNDDIEFYSMLGVNMDQASKKIDVAIKKGVLEEMKNENEIEEQKEKMEERRNRKRKNQSEEESGSSKQQR